MKPEREPVDCCLQGAAAGNHVWSEADCSARRVNDLYLHGTTRRHRWLLRQ